MQNQITNIWKNIAIDADCPVNFDKSALDARIETIISVGPDHRQIRLVMALNRYNEDLVDCVAYAIVDSAYSQLYLGIPENVKYDVCLNPNFAE